MEAKHARHAELMELIMSGRATDADNIEMERLSEEIGSGGDDGDEDVKRSRLVELTQRIAAGDATDADNIEAERLATELEDEASPRGEGDYDEEEDGEYEAPACSTLYYEGCDDEIDLEQAWELMEEGTIDDDTLVYSDDEGFPYEEWMAWSDVAYLFGMGDEPDGGGGYCNSLYYEGCDDEVEGLEAVEALVSDGVIGDDTLVYCDEDSFPYEEWTKWGECAYLFGLGEPPQLCYSLYYEGNDEEVEGLEDISALVADGTITDATMVYSDDAAWPSEGWEAWSDCAHLFSHGDEAPSTCASLYYEGGPEDEVSTDELEELVASGAITDETLIYSNDAAFAFDDWTPWAECKQLFSASGEGGGGGGGDDLVSQQQARLEELTTKIMAGDASEQENIEAEQLGEALDRSSVEEGVPPEGGAEVVDTSAQAEAAMAAHKNAAAAQKEAEAAAKAEAEAAAKAAKEAEEAAKRAEKQAQLDAIKAKKEAKKKAEAERREREAAEDKAACAAAGLGPVPTEISAAELEALPDAQFQEYFEMGKAKWGSLPPFRLPMVRKKAMAKYSEQRVALNRANALEWQRRKKAAKKAVEAEANRRLQMGDEIAKRGFAALRDGSHTALEPTAILCGKLQEVSSGSKMQDRFCMVWPKVRVPNVPAADRFLFVYPKAGAPKPSRVFHLHGGNYALKNKFFKKRKTYGIHFEAPLVSSSKSEQPKVKFVLSMGDKANRAAWVQACGSAELADDDDDAQHIVAGSGDVLSHFDFDVTMPPGPKGKKATLTVTREHVQVHQRGKLITDLQIKDVRSWTVGKNSVGFIMIKGTDITIGTSDMKQSQAIKDAMIAQAKAMIQARKDAKAAAAQEEREAAEETARKRAEADAKALEWLTYQELKDGTYDVRPVNLKMGPVDEKNKELWLRDADFEEIFGMTKAAFKKVPPFKRPLMKKKRGLAPRE